MTAVCSISILAGWTDLRSAYSLTPKEARGWVIDACSSRVLRTSKNIDQVNKTIFTTQGIGMVRPDKLGSISGSELKGMIEGASFPGKDYLNGRPITSADKNRIIANRNLGSIGTSSISIRYAIATSNVSVRTFPSAGRLSDATGRFDYLQETGLYLGEPMAVLWRSADSLWVYVQAANYRGWVLEHEIGYCDEKFFKTYCRMYFEGEQLASAKIDNGARLRRAVALTSKEVMISVAPENIRSLTYSALYSAQYSGAYSVAGSSAGLGSRTLLNKASASSRAGAVSDLGLGSCAWLNAASLLSDPFSEHSLTEGFMACNADPAYDDGMMWCSAQWIRMGTILPMGKYLYYPKRDAYGNCMFVAAPLEQEDILPVGSMSFSEKNIVELATRLLTTPYSWGDEDEHGTDCSSTVNSVYRCFGLFLPRNTGDQKKMPLGSTDLSGLSSQTKLALIRQMESGTLLYFPGHVMMLLGEYNGKLYILHNTTSATVSEGTIDFYSCVVTPIDTGISGNTYLDRMDRAVMIVP